jgi:SPP1 family holin
MDLELKVSRQTIIRTVVLVLALVNQILTSTGHKILPIDNDLAAELVTLLITIAASVWAWWKNNSFTQAAIQADFYKDALKEHKDDNAET